MGERNDLAFTRAARRSIAAQLGGCRYRPEPCPVVDLLKQGNLTVTARRRSFSADPAAVAAHAREFILAHRELGVFTALKHFLGLGGVLHPHAPGRGELIEDWSADELEPYRVLIRENLVDAGFGHAGDSPGAGPGLSGLPVGERSYRRSPPARDGFDGGGHVGRHGDAGVWDVSVSSAEPSWRSTPASTCCSFATSRPIVPYDDDRGPEAVRVIEEAVTAARSPKARIDEACARVSRS